MIDLKGWTAFLKKPLLVWNKAYNTRSVGEFTLSAERDTFVRNNYCQNLTFNHALETTKECISSKTIFQDVNIW